MWCRDKSNQGFSGLNKLKKTQYDNDHYGFLRSMTWGQLLDTKRKETFLPRLCWEYSDAHCEEEKFSWIPDGCPSRQPYDIICSVYVPQLPVRMWT